MKIASRQGKYKVQGVRKMLQVWIDWGGGKEVIIDSGRTRWRGGTIATYKFTM